MLYMGPIICRGIDIHRVYTPSFPSSEGDSSWRTYECT